MNLTLAIPFFNQLHDAKGAMGLLRQMTSKHVEWLVIDNGSSDPIESFFYESLKPPRLQVVRNETNVGMVATYNQIFELTETELVAVLHNDVFIYEQDWDKRVIEAFAKIDRLGMLGFFGAQGVGEIGERIQDVAYPGQMSGISNMLEAEAHGIRMTSDFQPVAILDGFAMVFSMQMIRDIGGLDTRYQYHHLYDRELPLMSLAHGYRNVVLNVPCHHWSGMTANRSEYQGWINARLAQEAADDHTHRENSKVFAKKWEGCLPLYVEDDFGLRAGKHGSRVYAGDAILSHVSS